MFLLLAIQPTVFQGLVLGFGRGTELLDVVPGRSKRSAGRAVLLPSTGAGAML